MCAVRPKHDLHGLLSPWPIPRPGGWARWVNDPQTPEEEESFATHVARSRPLGDAQWVLETAQRLGLEHTLRSPGRQPGWRKNTAEAEECQITDRVPFSLPAMTLPSRELSARHRLFRFSEQGRIICQIAHVGQDVAHRPNSNDGWRKTSHGLNGKEGVQGVRDRCRSNQTNEGMATETITAIRAGAKPFGLRKRCEIRRPR